MPYHLLRCSALLGAVLVAGSCGPTTAEPQANSTPATAPSDSTSSAGATSPPIAKSAQNSSNPNAGAAEQPLPPAELASELTFDSTLAHWREAPATERSHLAVLLARKRLPKDASKLEVATAAMEISGCLTATSGNPSYAAWQIEATAITCLTATERGAK